MKQIYKQNVVQKKRKYIHLICSTNRRDFRLVAQDGPQPVRWYPDNVTEIVSIFNIFFFFFFFFTKSGLIS